MKSSNLKPPWSTLFLTFCLTIFLSIPVSFFVGSSQQIFLISFALACSLSLYNDYVRPYWRKLARSRILEVVSTKDNTSPMPASENLASSPSLTPSTAGKAPISPTIEPIAASALKNLLTGKNHRLDRLRQYRLRCRYLTSVMLIILMVINFTANDFKGNWMSLLSHPGVIITLLVVLEYNVSLITGKSMGGIFFRDNSQPVESVSVGLEGEEKIGMLMKNNPFAIGTGVFGRPIVGTIFCWLWLLAIGSWVALVSYFVITLVLKKRFRKSLESPDGPFALLELRVFDTPEYGRFLELLEGWRYIGIQYRLDGPDTTGYSVASRFKVLSGKISELVIKNEVELDAALAQISSKPDMFERFSVSAMQCTDAIWIRALEKTIDQSDIVAMLLTDFRHENEGCATELKILMDTVPMSKVLLIINSATDLHYLSSILNDAWLNRAKDSPNHQPTQKPYVFNLNELYDHQSKHERPAVTIKMQLIDFLYSTIKAQ